MSDSDSSVDDNLKKIQEALDTQLISDNLYKNTPKEAVPEKPKSLRVSKDEEETELNILKLPPGAQKYVAKQLENFLEQSLSKQLVNLSENSCNKKRKRKKSKVRLFSDSEHFIDFSDQNLNSNGAIINNRPKIKTEFDSEDEEKLKMVLVEPEDVLSKKEVANWAKSTRIKKIFKYRKSKSGKVLVEL